MKKHLFALTMLLCILLPFSAALAAEPPLACKQCGNTDLGWFTLTSDGQDLHVRFCEPCYIMVGKSEPCEPIPGSATCITPERCKVCGYSMTTSLSPDPDAHAWSAPRYSWNYLGSGTEDEEPSFACTAIRDCKNYCGTVQMETVNASYVITTPSTCIRPGIVTYTASFEASWAETQVDDQLSTAPLADHTWVTDEAVEPTCTASGYTKYICIVCGDTYTDNITSALVHWYDPWNPNLDGTHSAECKRGSCNYVGTTECTLYEVTIMDDETKNILTVCPVCGDYKETFFEAILESSFSAIQTNALPRGEQIVRGMDAPFGGVLYAFTAAYEYAGKIEPFNSPVSVSIHLDAEKYTEFKLVRVDVTPATESTPRTEVWTDISFTFEDGKLTFETDTAGLFLLIPQQ